MIRNCANCGAEFYSKWSQSKYCATCKNLSYLKYGLRKPKGVKGEKRHRKAKPVEVACKVCGSYFTALSTKAMYCGECKKEVTRRQQRENARKNKKPPKSIVDPMMDYEQSDAIPKCPFWKDKSKDRCINCEGGRITEFKTRQDRLDYLHSYCAKNPGYMECEYAKELLAKYEAQEAG